MLDLKETDEKATDFLHNGKSFFRTSTILGLLLLAQTGWLGWITATGAPSIDFFTLWYVPQALSYQPAANIYSTDVQREMGTLALRQAQSTDVSDQQRRATAMVLQIYDGRIEVTGSPFLYATIRMLSSGNFLTDRRRFLFVSMLCLVLSVLLLRNLLRFSILETAVLLMFIFWTYEPFLSDITVGNVNEIQLLAIVLFIFFTARSEALLGGLAIGAATAFKPTTVMVLALAVIIGLVDQDYRYVLRMLGGCLAALGACVLASIVYFRNPAVWIDFLQSVPKTLSGSHSVESGNFSLSAFQFGMTNIRLAGISLILLAGFTWLLFSTRRANSSSAVLSKEADSRLRMHTAFCAGGCGCAIMLLSSPLVWLHYYLLLLPLSLYLLSSGPEIESAGVAANTGPWTTFAAGLPFIPLVVFSLLFARAIANVRVFCMLIILSTVLTLVLASHRIWQRRRVLNLLVPAP